MVVSNPSTAILRIGRPRTLLESEAVIAQLQNDLQIAHAEIRRLERLLNVPNENRFASIPDTWKGRPVISCAAAAKRGGVSLATVSRYLNNGDWSGERISNPKKWVVYADQDFTRKTRKGAK